MNSSTVGNQAVARGLYEAGVKFVSSYPGTPSTEITEYVSEYDEIYSEWAPNEKVAVEAAFGASTGGVRAVSAMKHVGLNVAADPLFTSSYIGVTGGFVIAVADDQGMHSSQNEQDSRHYARASKIMMVEPSDSAECKEFVKIAYELSEQFDSPILLRLSTRISHSRSLIEIGERDDRKDAPYEKDALKRVMMPGMARGRHVVVEKRIEKQKEFAKTSSLNRIEYNDKKIGVIASGIAYQYAKEALGDSASYLKLGIVWPMSDDLIREFASNVDKLYVIEELDDFIEQHVKTLGIEVEGKSLFSFRGEYTPNTIAQKILGKKAEGTEIDVADVPQRPPVMCAGCPHRGVFYVLSKLGLTVSGDIGCYTLGASAPLSAIDWCLCMGASVSALHGFNKANKGSAKKSVGVIGDSTFAHSGITGLCNIVYNMGNSTIIILDNSITGMTGHQQNPTTGYTIKGDPTYSVDLSALCASLGVKNVSVVDPFDLNQVESVIKAEVEKDEPSVIIARRPCALIKSAVRGKTHAVDREKCKSCKKCLKLGCPALSFEDGKAKIDPMQCTGCTLCAKVCPFGAISEVDR